MKTIFDIQGFLRQNHRLRKFMVENGIHINKITQMKEDRHFRISKGVGAVTSTVYSGEITYIVSGDVFKAIIKTDKDYICFALSSLDLFE